MNDEWLISLGLALMVWGAFILGYEWRKQKWQRLEKEAYAKGKADTEKRLTSHLELKALEKAYEHGKAEGQADLIEKVEKQNPYPKDIFREPSQSKYKKMQEAMKRAGLIQDAFFGSFGRDVWQDACDMMKLGASESSEKAGSFGVGQLACDQPNSGAKSKRGGISIPSGDISVVLSKPEKPKTRLNPRGGRELKSSGIYPKKVKR